MSEVVIVKANGEKEVFDPTKLENSLLRAGAKAPIVDDILKIIQNEIETGMTTKEIYRNAFELLGKKNRPVAANYSLRRAIMDLGPSGFPFENLISEIFKAKGYEVEIGRVVEGKCVEHEIDVLAFNEENLDLIEAKFHNQLGVKTDTKVALYVKARYDDLKDVEIYVGDVARKMTAGWLITNTKFTTNAVKYGKCQDLKFIGWNYPKKGNLHDMIIESKLHPLTSLTTTSKSEERMLLEKGVTLLRQLRDNPSELDVLGLSEERKAEIMEEVNLILSNV